MKTNLKFLLASSIIISSIYFSVLAQNIEQENEKMKKGIEIERIKMAETPLNVPAELKGEIAESIKKDFIIFHEQIWGFLPQAKSIRTRYRIDKVDSGANVYMATTFENDKYALISKLSGDEYTAPNNVENAITTTIKYGILPSIYIGGVSKKDLDYLDIIEIVEVPGVKNRYRSLSVFNGDLIETYHILEEENQENIQRIFSISSKK